jgi:hypothetical protein
LTSVVITRTHAFLLLAAGRFPSGDTIMVTGFALAALAVLLPLPLGLGWRASLLLAAACYPLAILGAADGSPFSPPWATWPSRP